MRTLVACRACQYAPLDPYCDLGEQPLANAFVSDPSKPEGRYPLALAHCPNCWLSQLTVVVDADTLYRNYHYVSGVSPAWVSHCEHLVSTLRCKKQFVVEIASNDGTLLRLLKDQGASVLGVEPAMNLVAKYPSDLPYLPDFFTDQTARWIKTRYGHPDIVIGQNVMGHVDDIRGFLTAIRITLKQNGMAVLEAPYLYKMLATGEFPQVYHEHLSYWSLVPLQRLARSVGLDVTSVRPINVHGGSMRYYLRHNGHQPDATVPRLAEHERDMQAMPGLREWFDPRPKIEKLEADLEQYRGKQIWGYGASAKSTVLLNAIKNADVLGGIVDDYAGKQGRYQPGTHLPILPPQDLSHLDALLVTAWNWAEAIQVQAKRQGFSGTYLYPFGEAA